MRNTRPTSAFTSSNVRGVLTVDGTIRCLSTISSVEGIKVGGNLVVDGSATIAGIIDGSISGNADTVTNPNLKGDVTTSGLNATVANSAVISKVLTGYVSGAGTVAATDTILQAIQKLNGNAGGGAAAAGTLTGTTLASNVVSSSLTSVGTLTAVNTSGVITGTDTTASTSSTTGALIIAGGAGIAKDSFINGMIIGTRGTASCTAIGANALLSSTAANCTAVGSGALQSNTGLQCTAVGVAAAFANTGSNVTAVGLNALRGNVAASNTAIGYGALYTGVASQPSGSSNTAGGVSSLDACTSGTTNSAWGSSSLGALTTGASNVGIGDAAGSNLTTGNNCTIIGANTTISAAGDNNSIVIGKSAVGIGSNTTVIGTSATTSAKVWGAVTAAGTMTADAYILSSSGIQAKTASYTLVAADNGKVITMSVATANTLTVPASLAVGFNCTIIQIGAGQTTITASGTTLNSVSSFLKISAQHGSASIISYASNVYNVAGSLSA